MDGNRGSQPLTTDPRTAQPSHESQTSLPVPDEQRTAAPAPVTSSTPSSFLTNSSHVNETPNTPPPHELSYSVLNARPPGAAVNHAYEPDPSHDVKYVDPPTYEEAIKAMQYRPPEEPDHLQYHRCPDQGQFSTSEPYTYHQTCTNEFETELAKSFCSRIIFAIVIFAFAASAIRVLYFVT